MNKSIYTVAQVNRYIGRLLLGDDYLQSLSVSGEVSNLKYHQSGHIYFSLKDQTAALSCVMFAGQRRGLAFPMKNGDKVVVNGAVKAFERDGRYELIAKRITLAGEGALYEAYIRLRDELRESGYFDSRYKKPVPKYALRIGIVSAPNGAAVWDIENVARRRNPYVQLVLCPAYVEGPEAKYSIASGIRRLDGTVDVIIVGRGGGSLEQLWAFNERLVADAIMECGTPIVSAVGHEVDTTIADYVADLRAATPTEAAELTVFDCSEFLRACGSAEAALSAGMQKHLTDLRHHCRFTEASLRAVSPMSRLAGERRRAGELSERLIQPLAAKTEACRERLTLLDRTADTAVTMRLQELDWHRELLKDRLKSGAEKKLSADQQKLVLYAERFAGRNPLERLRQGYSYTEDAQHRAVTSVSGVRRGDALRVYVTDGYIEARAEDIHDRTYGS